jgi:hypothetical protein
MKAPTKRKKYRAIPTTKELIKELTVEMVLVSYKIGRISMEEASLLLTIK